ncbi:MAG TPA: hypothetical protein VGG34_14925 [Opitutaceae bacterium]|jgi:hypothetical protein
MQFAAVQQPALTCEAVISGACFLLEDVPEARRRIFALVERGLLRVIPVLPEEYPAVRELITRHGKWMDYVDACLVRLSGLFRNHTVVTTDAEDFRTYRRFKRQSLLQSAP